MIQNLPLLNITDSDPLQTRFLILSRQSALGLKIGNITYGYICDHMEGRNEGRNDDKLTIYVRSQTVSPWRSKMDE